MAKKDEVTLIIAKSFAKQRLTPKERELCCDLTISELIKDYCLNDIQADHVVQWCALQQSSLKHSEQKEMLEEGFFSNIKDRFKKKPVDLEKAVKTNIEISGDLNDTALGSYLKHVSSFVSRVESKGLYRKKLPAIKKIKDYNDLLDATQTDDYDDHDKIPEYYLREIKVTLSKLKHAYNISNTMFRKKFTSAKNENRNIESGQIRDLLKINANAKHMSLKKRANYYREVSNLIDLICKNENINFGDCQHEVSLVLSKYIGTLYNRLLQVYKHEQKLTTKTTTNY